MPATRIALRPFENLSRDPSQDVLAKGLGLDLATELARFSTVEVIPPTSPRASAPPARDDSTSLFVLAGGVRRSEQRIRITAQLTDATSGRRVWAERYDAEEDRRRPRRDRRTAVERFDQPSRTPPRFARLVEANGIDVVLMGPVARTGIAGLVGQQLPNACYSALRGSVVALKPLGFQSPIVKSQHRTTSPSRL